MGEQKRTPTPSESQREEEDYPDINEDDVVEVIELDDEDIEGMEGEEEDEDEGMEEKRHFNVERDDAVCTFEGHEGSVFCCHLNPADQNVAVTGGEDDVAFVWKIQEKTIQSKLEGFKDSVTTVAFSQDGVYVAAGDMSGRIQVFKVADGQQVWEFDVADLNWMAWHNAAHVLFAGDNSGALWMWQIPSGNCKTFQGSESNECGKLFHDGKRVVCGYSDGSVKVWDLKSGQAVNSWSGQYAHSGMVTSLDIKNDDSLIISGATDGTAKLYNVAAGKLLTTFVCSTEEDESLRSVETVAFAPASLGLQIVATGNLKGLVSLWDLPTQVERCRVAQTDGIVRLAWASDQPIIHTVSLDGVVATIDARTGAVVRKQMGHSSNILDMSLATNGAFILTSSDDSTAKVFKLV